MESRSVRRCFRCPVANRSTEHPRRFFRRAMAVPWQPSVEAMIDRGRSNLAELDHGDQTIGAQNTGAAAMVVRQDRKGIVGVAIQIFLSTRFLVDRFHD